MIDMTEKSRKIEIYTDGAARGNPGPGGYGIVLKYDNHRKEISRGFKYTTNNRMELLAVIVALEQLKYKRSEVVLYSDSSYVCNAINKGWIKVWEKKGFRKTKNPDLWKRFLNLYRDHNVQLVWIKGHSENPDNDICDQLAVTASKENNLPEDEGYLSNEDKLF
jgi:ribonuclease HI